VTEAEAAVTAVIAERRVRRGYCDRDMEDIAASAGVSLSALRNAA
jgi:AcrR family transcriptional regulator